MNAHIAGDGAQIAAAIGYFPLRWHKLKAGADALAVAGAGMLTGDPCLIAKYRWMMYRVRLRWRYLLRVYATVRLQTHRRETAGLAERIRPQGPNSKPRKELTETSGCTVGRHKAALHAAAHPAKAKDKQGRSSVGIIVRSCRCTGKC